MSIWKSKDPSARVVTGFPVSYADRMRVQKEGGLRGSPYAHVDGGSVERWEPDGYGRARTYKDVFEGRWEDYDPWEVRIPRGSILPDLVLTLFLSYRAAPA
jgi:hypothetical protein